MICRTVGQAMRAGWLIDAHNIPCYPKLPQCGSSTLCRCPAPSPPPVLRMVGQRWGRRVRSRLRSCGSCRRGVGMNRFVGNYTMRLDAKGRVSIPAPFRSVLARDGFDGLYCYPTLDRTAIDAGGNALLGEIEKLIERFPS